MSSRETQRRSPYKGLIPYAEQDAPFFFGREKETRLITANLFASSLTLLYGASGVGKSSVLRAGVANQLRQRDDLIIVVFNSWQGNPANDLIQAISDQVKLTDPVAWSRITDRMPGDSEITLPEYLVVCADELKRRPMIMLDQFEEYFLYHPLEDSFATSFAKAITARDLPVSFLISIREDFYARLDRFEGRIPSLYDNYLRIEHLNRAAARTAIEKPIAEYNRRYSSEQPFVVEPDLVNAVLSQVETGQVILGEAGRGMIEGVAQSSADARIETPFLQLVMTRLWNAELAANSHTLHLQTLNDLGGAANIVRTHLDAVISKLTPREQEVAAGIFHYLVTPSGTKIAYTAPDLAGSAGLSQGEVVEVLERLTHGDVRILRPVDPTAERPGVPRYEIFHDVLAPAILAWRSSYVQALERADAERRAEEQRQRADEQARVASRFRRLAMALAILILLALGTAVFAIAQTVRARTYALKADNYAKESDRLREEGRRDKELAKSERRGAEIARAAANEAQIAADKERKKTEEQIKIADQRKTEAARAQHTAEQAGLAADAANASANRAVRDAEKQASATRVSFANLLSVQSKTLLDGFPQLSTLLGVEAMRATGGSDAPVPAAEEALRYSLSRTSGRTFSSLDWSQDEGSGRNEVAASADGRWLATATNSNVRLFDVANTTTSEPSRTFAGSTFPIAFSSDGRWLIASGKPPRGEASTIILWDLQNRTPNAQPLNLRGRPTRLEFMKVSPDSRWLIAGNHKDCTLLLWDLKASTITNKSLSICTAKPDSQTQDSLLTFGISPDSRWLVTSAGAYEMATMAEGPVTRLWNLAEMDTSAQPLPLAGHKYPVTEIVFSTDARWVATGSLGCDNGVRLWDLKTANPSVKPFVLDHPGSIGAIAFSLSNQFLVTGSGSANQCSTDLKARVWKLADLASGAKPYILPSREGPIFAIAFSPDENLLITVIGRGYSVLTGPLASIFHRSTFSENSRTLGNLGLEGGATLHTWNWKELVEGESEGEQPNDLSWRLPEFANFITVSSDSRWLAAAGKNKAFLIDLAEGGGLVWPMITLRGHDNTLDSAAFSPDNRKLVTSGYDGITRLWNLSSGGGAAPLRLAANVPSATSPSEQLVVKSPDGRLLLATTAESDVAGETDQQRYAHFGAVALVSNLMTDDPSQARPLRGHKGKIKAAAFSRDNKWLVTGSEDKTARLWDLTATDPAAQQRIFEGHLGSVDDVAISADKRWLATASHDGATRLWNLVDPAAPPIVLGTFKSPVSESYQYSNRVRMSPDGRWLVTSGSYFFGAPARLWDLKNSAPAETALNLGLTMPDEGEFTSDSHWFYLPRIYDDANHRFKPGPFIWDLTRNPATATKLEGSDDRPYVYKFSADGRWLFIIGDANEIVRWDLKDLTAARLVLKSPSPDPKQTLGNIEISPDNRWVISDLAGPKMKGHVLWDLKAPDPNTTVRLLKNDAGYGVTEVAFDPNGRWLITSYDGSSPDLESFFAKTDNVAEGHNIRWDLTSTDPLIAPVRMTGGRLIRGAEVSADGRWLMTAGMRAIEFWSMRREDLLATACRTAGRNLNEAEWKTYFPGQPYQKTCAEWPVPK